MISPASFLIAFIILFQKKIIEYLLCTMFLNANVKYKGYMRARRI